MRAPVAACPRRGVFYAFVAGEVLGDEEDSGGEGDGEERIERAVWRAVMPAPRIAVLFLGEAVGEGADIAGLREGEDQRVGIEVEVKVEILFENYRYGGVGGDGHRH